MPDENVECDPGSTTQSGFGAVKNLADKATEAVHGAADKAAGAVKDAASSVRHTAEDVGRNIRDAAEHTYEAVGRGTRRSYEWSRDHAREWSGDVDSYVRRKPLNAALIAGGVGILLGVLWKRKS